MLIPCFAKLGFDGNSQRIGRIRLNESTIADAVGFAGSYHVLVMDRHYRDYVVTGTFPRFPVCNGLPAAHPYVFLGVKQRAAGVTGNIGEAATGLVGQRVLRLSIPDIVHVKPRQGFGRRKSPDFMMHAGTQIQRQLSAVWPAGFAGTLPDWWPAESKARQSAEDADYASRTEAFPQLAAYWHSIHNNFPYDVGFGMTVALAYEHPAQVTITLFLPQNQSALLSHLRGKPYKQYRDQFDSDTETRRSLYGCQI